MRARVVAARSGRKGRGLRAPLPVAGDSGPTRLRRRPGGCACGGGCPRCDASKSEGPGRATGPGRPLPAGERAFFEPRLGADLGDIRLHEGAAAAEAAQALGARAFTLGRHVVLGGGEGRPGSREGRRLMAHELAHSLQQRETGPRIQRKLLVTTQTRRGDPFEKKAKAPGFQKTFFDHVEGLIQSLCGGFELKRGKDSAEVRPSEEEGTDCGKPGEVAKGAKAGGCCCLCIMTDSKAATWTIKVTDEGPRSNAGSKEILIHPPGSAFTIGAFSGSGKLVLLDDTRVLGHELCGHAALHEAGGHPDSNERRATSDTHDPTVRIENLISTEQGAGAGELRGLAGSGKHRGESVAKITIDNYLLNSAVVRSSQRDKLRSAISFIKKRNTWVDILGHSDRIGSPEAKLSVSKKRAETMRKVLRGNGVSAGIVKTFTGLPGEAPITVSGQRFTRVEGRSDFDLLPGVSDDAKQRRVDILMAPRPAGAQKPIFTPSAAQEKTVKPEDEAKRDAALKSPNACIRLLVGTAWPKP